QTKGEVRVGVMTTPSTLFAYSNKNRPTGYPSPRRIARVLKDRLPGLTYVAHIVPEEGVPYSASIRRLHELGLRPDDLVRLNLATFETWKNDLQVVRKDFPEQPLSLQVRANDLDRRTPEEIARSIADLAEDGLIQEWQLDRSQSKGEPFNPKEYLRFLQAVK